jgi:hypothetical protein
MTAAPEQGWLRDLPYREQRFEGDVTVFANVGRISQSSKAGGTS